MAYGDYWLSQAELAGMGARDVAQTFDEAAQVRGSATGLMASSKFHIGRIYTAQARPKPPVAFRAGSPRSSMPAGSTWGDLPECFIPSVGAPVEDR